jgi:hypothetical protein
MVCFLGAFVRWEESTDPKTPALSTGRLDPSFEPSDVRGAIRFETVRLSLDEDLDTQKTALAKIILENSPLAADLVAHLTRKLVAGHSFPAQKSQKT